MKYCCIRPAPQTDREFAVQRHSCRDSASLPLQIFPAEPAATSTRPDTLASGGSDHSMHGDSSEDGRGFRTTRLTRGIFSRRPRSQQFSLFRIARLPHVRESENVFEDASRFLTRTRGILR